MSGLLGLWVVWVWGIRTSVPSKRPESAILVPMSTAVARPFSKMEASGAALVPPVVTGTSWVVTVVVTSEVFMGYGRTRRKERGE